MSGKSILGNPGLFSGTIVDLDVIAHEYLTLFEEYPGEAEFFHVKAHLFKIL